MAAKLTPKQKRFVDEYLIDLNATQAAIRAGYSPKTANEQAAQLLAKLSIQNYLHKRQSERVQRTEITQDRVLQELAAVGFARGTDYAEIAPDGTVRLIPTEQLSGQQRAAVLGIRETRDGVEIKLADKVRALELLGKHLGLFSPGAGMNAADSNLFERIAEATSEEGDYGIPEVQSPPEDDDDMVAESGDTP